MSGNPLVHFFILRNTGCQKYFSGTPHPVCQVQGVATFAASASANDKGCAHVSIPELNMRHVTSKS
jgi:hypothetical protein